MPLKSGEALEEKIMSFLKGFSGRPVVELDQFIGRDIGIHGGDGVQILYELEEKFGVDLNPLIDSVTVYSPPSWFDRLCGRAHGPPAADVTVRQLVEYISNAVLRSSR